jgi:hypothetical protein
MIRKFQELKYRMQKMSRKQRRKRNLAAVEAVTGKDRLTVAFEVDRLCA